MQQERGPDAGLRTNSDEILRIIMRLWRQAERVHHQAGVMKYLRSFESKNALSRVATCSRGPQVVSAICVLRKISALSEGE